MTTTADITTDEALAVFVAVAGLTLEALMSGGREPIVEIIRRHPPTRFVTAAIPLTFPENSPCR
jgi:hypothetical protein